MAETCERKFERWRKKGDTDALADVFDAIAPRLMRLAVHLVGDVAAAEDLVQSTFVTAIEDASAWDPSRPLEPWLTGILDNRAKRLLKSRERPIDRAAREDVDHDTPLARAMESEMSSELVKAIDQLDEPYRSVMVLSVLHHLEPAAIAHALDRSPGSVRVQLHRGREMVRKALPAGVLTSAVMLASSGRGLAAIKSAVLTHAGHATATSIVSATAGALAMKKILLVLTLLVLVAGGVTVAVRTATSDDSRRMTGVPITAAEVQSGTRTAVAAAPPEDSSRKSALAAHTLSVSGRVIDTKSFIEAKVGAPDVDCPLLITIGDKEGKAPLARITTKTDAQGSFHVEFERAQEDLTFVRVSCEADDRACAAFTTRRVESNVDHVEELLVARPARGVLAGVTLDAHDAPLPGVLVRFKSWGAGSTPLEAISDASGRFEFFPPNHQSGVLEAELEGWSTFEGPDARANPDGGWDKVTLVLARRGTLRVHVSEADGTPVVKEAVRVSAAPGEPHRTSLLMRTNPSWLSGETGADGTATLDALWIGKRLAVTVGRAQQGDSWSPSPSQWMKDGRLLADEAVGSEAIVIGSTGFLDVSSVRDPYLNLHGTVSHAEGARAAGAVIEVRDAAAIESSTRLLATVRADQDGRFSLHLPWNAGIGELRITAAESAWEKQNWLSDEDKPMASAGFVSFDPLTRDAAADIEIVLSPLLSISGRAQVAGQTITGGRITAVPAGSGSSLALSNLARICLCAIAPDGQFRVENLMAGRYDLYARGTTRDAEFEQFLPDIEAGRNDVELVVDAGRDASVHIHAVSSHGTVAKMIIMTGTRASRRSTDSECATLGTEVTLRSLTAWPPEAPVGFTQGACSGVDGSHQSIFIFRPCKGADYDLVPRVTGNLYLGVEAELADGRTCFPMSTGFVHVSPGEHTVTFDVVPTTDLEGRVHGIDEASPYEIRMVDGAGTLIPVLSRGGTCGTTTPPMGLRDDGWFRFAGVPVGRFRLRIERRSHGAASDFLFDQPVDIVENGPPLAIDLHQ